MPPSGLLLDAAAEFLRLLQGLRDPPPEEVLALWEVFYRSRFPELYEKQIGDYADQGEDGRAVALARVFPTLLGRLSAMEEARAGILRLWGDVLGRARGRIGLEGEIQAVVHVGIGCGAGWATTYGGRPAVLFDLGSVAELGWESEERLEGLIAHELGHLAHARWRGEPLEPLEEDPFGLLYVEGFAQRLEQEILARESWHQAPSEGWLPWCQAHLADLARAYQDRATQGEAVNDFFGSWRKFQGLPLAGYVLGHTVIRVLEEERGLRELAQAPWVSVRASVIPLLAGLAEGRPMGVQPS
ncbi:MAG: hypothetical protein N2320_06170 [Candidatus Bipolaricaulota bacterium]|nr:hypothetical protein [Candidatus Bipolaricaulota bacterium]